MTQELATVIRAAKALSQREKLELLQVITQDLQQSNVLLEENAIFWSSPSLEELITEQQPLIVRDVSVLSADFWPMDESADDINEYIEEKRKKG